MTRWLAAIGVACGLAACVRLPYPHHRVTVPAESDGDARLSDEVVPQRYRLILTVDPSQPGFSGEAWITVRLAVATSVIRLHGKDLDVRHAETPRPNAQRATDTLAATVVRGKNGSLALVFPEPLPAGESVLHFFYDGRFADGLTGMYRVRSNDDYYVFTQFEALHARKAFPCFDEPRFKTPWEITLRVPHGLVTAGNAPVTETRPQGAIDLVRFAPTEPLPTYLVALAVGPFDVVAAPGLPDGVPLRLLAVHGKGPLAAYALQRTPRILATLADYFDRPYPYRKLDLVAVPDFGAGAMENAGLVTFRDRLLLLDPARASAEDKLDCEVVLAHELAHQWFGDLVTMTWWDDLWLNEGFATWMETKVVMTTAPELHVELDAVRSAASVMEADAREAARAVRQPITNGGDVINAFDDITYEKGAAILRMLEAWAGAERFRAGIRLYITAHAWQTARTSDLFAALEQTTAQPIGAVAATFLDQPGTPLLDVVTTCKRDTATVQFTQSRYRPEGSRAPQGQPWSVPVCWRYKTGGSVHRQCTLVSTATAQLRLEQPGCPSWLHPNADESGYYLWRLPEAELLGLVSAGRERLSAPEEAALPGHLDALLMAAQLDAGTYLEALTHLVQSDQRHTVAAAVDGLGRIHHATVDFDGGVAPPAFARFVRSVLGARGRQLGLLPKPADSPDAQLLRPKVLSVLADLGQDGTVRTQARDVARRFLARPRSVPAAAAQLAVPIAALDGDAGFQERLMTVLKRTDDPSDRAVLLSGLGTLRDPALFERSLALYLTDALRVNEFWTVTRGAAASHALQVVAFRWMTASFDALTAKLGDEATSYLPAMGAGFCDGTGRAWVQRLFADPAHQRPGSARNLAHVLEDIDQCIRLRARATAPIAAFLAARASAVN